MNLKIKIIVLLRKKRKDNMFLIKLYKNIKKYIKNKLSKSEFIDYDYNYDYDSSDDDSFDTVNSLI